MRYLLSHFVRAYFTEQTPVKTERKLQYLLGTPVRLHVDNLDDLLCLPNTNRTVLDDIEEHAQTCCLGTNGKALRNYFALGKDFGVSPDPGQMQIDHGIASAIMLLRSYRELSGYMTRVSDYIRTPGAPCRASAHKWDE